MSYQDTVEIDGLGYAVVGRRGESGFYFIIGADSLFQLETWYHPEQVMAMAVLLVAAREYHTDHTMDEEIRRLTEKYGAKIALLHSRMMDISSEEIRRLASLGLPFSQYVPPKVEAYIKAHGLYCANESTEENETKKTQKERS